METSKKIILRFVVLFLLFNSCKKDNDCNPPVVVPPNGMEEIIMQNSIFIPVEKTITRGTTVRWVNRDPYAHTVTSDNNYDSGNMNEQDIFEHQFNIPGTIDYYCKYHLPGMTGKIIVQ